MGSDSAIPSGAGHLSNEGGNGISGALAKGDIYKPSISGSLIYLATSNIEETLSRALEKGAEVLFPRTSVPDIGFVAELKDCEGNRVALFQRK